MNYELAKELKEAGFKQGNGFERQMLPDGKVRLQAHMFTWDEDKLNRFGQQLQKLQ